MGDGKGEGKGLPRKPQHTASSGGLVDDSAMARRKLRLHDGVRNRRLRKTPDRRRQTLACCRRNVVGLQQNMESFLCSS